jgi:RNA polymerase sigma-70 factor (ECF subfamily)
MMEHEPDTSYLGRLQSREPRAVQEWFEGFADSLYTYVFYRVDGDEQTAADVVQDTFLEALAHIDQYEPERGTMAAWLTTLSRNYITRALKARGRFAAVTHWQSVDADLIARFHRLASEQLPTEVLERKETQDLVQMTLASIPGNYRKVLVLHYHRGLSLRDIASRVRKSEGAIKVLLHRARQAFKEAFLRLAGVRCREGGQP